MTVGRFARLTALCSIIVLGLAGGCGSGDGDASTTSRSTRPVAAPIVATWTRVTSCQHFVDAVNNAGLQDYLAEWIVGAGFWSDTRAIPSPQPCAGTPRQVEHSHFFRADGTWGSRDEHGAQVDDGTYELIDDHTLGFPLESGNFRVTYSISGDSLTITAVSPPTPCNEACRHDHTYLLSAFYTGDSFRKTG